MALDTRSTGFRMGKLWLPHEGTELEWRQLRGLWVLRDRQVATLLGTTTRALNRRYRRAPHRFPPDFGFRLTREEFWWAFRRLEGGPDRSGGGEPVVYSAAGVLRHWMDMESESSAELLRWIAQLLPALQAPSPASLPLIPPRS